MEPVHRIQIKIGPEVIDQNGHVNNVAYVQWMQDVAISHARLCGCSDAIKEIGASWVVRTHFVEYLRPAYPGEIVTALTWVSNFGKVRSLRKYKFIRESDSAVLARAETDWVFVDSNGHPASIPDFVKEFFVTVGKDEEP